MLQVMQIDGVRFKKYVLQNQFTGIVVNKRFWTVRGAQRQIRRNHMNLNKAINRINKTGKA